MRKLLSPLRRRLFVVLALASVLAFGFVAIGPIPGCVRGYPLQPSALKAAKASTVIGPIPGCILTGGGVQLINPFPVK